MVPDLERRLSTPLPVGSAVVAVAVIDSHVVLPAVGGVATGCLVGALGTSAAYLYLSRAFKPLPPGIEGVAKDGTLRDLWCYEAGQAGFGDLLAWFVRTFPRGADLDASFSSYNAEAEKLKPGANHLLALDWWSGNRVPLADSGLSGLLAGFTMHTTAAGIYRALVEALCYGARTVVNGGRCGDPWCRRGGDRVRLCRRRASLRRPGAKAIRTNSPE